MSLKRLITTIAAAALLTLRRSPPAAAAARPRPSPSRRRPQAPTTTPSRRLRQDRHASSPACRPTDHGWLGAISKNAKEAAEQYDDVEFELLEAADADSQAQQIEQAISDKPDALVVLPQDGAALTPVAQKAEEAGIPVVNIDRLFTDARRGHRDDARRQLPDRRARGRLHRRASSTARATSSRSRASPASR